MNPLLSTACFLSLSALAQPLPPPSADSVQLSLPEVEVGATEKPTVRVLGRSRIHWDMAALARLPQVMGNSDPVRSVRLHLYIRERAFHAIDRDKFDVLMRRQTYPAAATEGGAA